ncbi:MULTISPECIES: hypothetical protein [unclassified Kitasatospora]|uniref:hypothetical protein n=1 Tax=unclassified Kitasatospora TaxID=2633591 RepID=UPI0033EBB4DB
MRHERKHLLDVGRIHAAFVTDARARGEACGPLDLLPAPELPAGEGGVCRPAAHLADTAGTGDEQAAPIWHALGSRGGRAGGEWTAL